MSNTLTVIIIKCRKATYWYNDLIDEVFTVSSEELPTDYRLVSVDNSSNKVKKLFANRSAEYITSSFISKEDCVIVDDNYIPQVGDRVKVKCYDDLFSFPDNDSELSNREREEIESNIYTVEYVVDAEHILLNSPYVYKKENLIVLDSSLEVKLIRQEAEVLFKVINSVVDLSMYSESEREVMNKFLVAVKDRFPHLDNI
jgi:hypothetical protein